MHWFNFSFRDWVLAEGVNTNLLTAQYKKRFPQATEEEIAEKIQLAVAADPTPNKQYVTWIFRELLNNRMRLPEDSPVTLQQLAIFDKSKPALKRLGKEVDITKYDRPTLWKTLSELGGVTSKRAEAAKVKQEGAEKIYEDDEWLVIKMTKPEACTYYARGTKWCTSNAEVASGYLDEGPLFMIYRNGQVYAQAHVESGQLMDPEDVPIPPGKVPEKLRDIIKQHVPVDDEYKGKRNELFGIKEKVIEYPDGFYWGTSNHKDFLLIAPSGEEEVFLRNVDGTVWVDRPKDKTLEGIMDRKGDWKKNLEEYKHSSNWNKYIVDFILKNKSITHINPLQTTWNLGDLSEEDRNTLFTARQDLMPPIEMKTDGYLWTALGLGSYVLLDKWYPTLSMQMDNDGNLSYGNWLNKSQSKILNDEKFDKSKYSLATAQFLIRNNIEHYPRDNRTRHYNSWEFKDLLPEHQAMVLQKFPHFNDDLVYHQKQSTDQKELLKRLGSSSGLYDMQSLDEKTVILRPYDTLSAEKIGDTRHTHDLFGSNYEEKDRIKKLLYNKINGYGDGSIGWEFEQDFKNGNLDKIKENLPFLDTELLKGADPKSYTVANSLANAVGKHVMREFMKILYNDLKPFENDKFKIVLKDDNIYFVTDYDNVINYYKQEKNLKSLEEEYKKWHKSIKIPFETLEQQIVAIPREVDKEDFVKNLNSDKYYQKNKYSFSN